MTNEEGFGSPPYQHLRAADALCVEEPENALRMRQILTGLESGGSMSLTWVQLEGMHRRLRVRRSRRVYYILSGTFTFQVEGATAVDVSADDVLLLEPGATYRFEGRGNYLVLNTPAFAPGDDEYKDEERAQRT